MAASIEDEAAAAARVPPDARWLPGQVVLVLQGGGALGAYQAGVYQALHEAGIEPDWVIGTSIGAINAALIAGNAPELRLARLHAFWDGIEESSPAGLRLWPPLQDAIGDIDRVVHGVPGFFAPNPGAWLGPHAPLGVEAAAYYDTAPLAETLGRLVDFNRLGAGGTRLTVGAVNVRTGTMKYFDSRHEADGPLGARHVMASGALPPAFPAIRIKDVPYWDGGIYSNTPIEAVLDDQPRRNSLIFMVNVWQPDGDEPQSIWQVLGRQKDIQYASRADSHIERQQQMHQMRRVIRELAERLPPEQRDSAEVRELTAWGCTTTMHVVRLLAPGLDDEDHTKDIDFSATGIRRRWKAGVDDTAAVIAQAPWEAPVDPKVGIVVHLAGPHATATVLPCPPAAKTPTERP